MTLVQVHVGPSTPYIVVHDRRQLSQSFKGLANAAPGAPELVRLKTDTQV